MSRRISDFRPISLITSLYKIIAKVLAGRIRGVLHETIHSTQGAFVQGRQILDAVLIANEIVDEKRRSGEEGVVFKIDFEKAYDHVSWDFLDHVLEMKGFGIRWRKWMRGCLSSVSFAVLVNGNAKGWVKASRGLRQGDPLSPFLFTIVADVLSRMLLKAEERNVLEGFKVGRNRTRVSHLQFADDTIFFSSYREEDMMTLKNVLLVFGHISGLKVNLDKSNIYGINLEQNHLSRLAEMLDCKASGWPILYLGLPLGGNPKTSGFWDPVIERISRRLDGWQKAYLSFGGRITLIQSCLTHMPCYFLSLFKIPASVAAKIERMQRDFLWSGVGEGKRDHLVNWDVVCKPKSRGGLGFGKISIRNVALLGKWLWRYPREGSALWHQVILSIYGSHSNGWDVNNIVRWSHRCPWKAIALVYQEFSKFTRFVVGNGDRIRFWDDLWWGEQPLGVQYPRLLRVVTDKNAPISSILGYTRPFSWNFTFRRNLSDSEIEDLEGLMQSLIVYTFHLRFQIRDLGPYLLQVFSQSNLSFWPYPNILSRLQFSLPSLSGMLKSLLKSSPLSGWWLTRSRSPLPSLLFDDRVVAQIISISKDGLGFPRSISDMLSSNFNGFGFSKRGIVLWQNACIANVGGVAGKKCKDF
ncbi:LINE-1 retrotransposable element ORF2 protein [Vitis vinifera]|uniref:LINE-1 retrotransposable element ORF2 protein n=1 Tax=Vitis vinifera TaxID=29760 RepID=A0A438EG91_VITVI|nr:LINE-1 retrotransposable element ORF2 protein [Vitis vinifera]